MDSLRKFTILFLLSVFLCSVLEGCKPECDKEALFLQTTGLSKDDNINQTMRIDYLNGQKVTLRKGEYQQFDTPLYDLKQPIKFIVGESEFFYIFNKIDCQWQPIKNDIIHFGNDVIVEPEPRQKVIWIGSNMFIDPAVIVEPTKVRVLVKGYYLDEEGEIAKPIAAFMDVVIEP